MAPFKIRPTVPPVSHRLTYYRTQRDYALSRAQSPEADRDGWLRIASEWQKLIDSEAADPSDGDANNLNKRDPKTKDELERIFSDELNDPTVSVSVYSSNLHESGWLWHDDVRAATRDRLNRVMDVAERLQKRYRIKDE